jgi:hypothetical protein
MHRGKIGRVWVEPYEQVLALEAGAAIHSDRLYDLSKRSSTPDVSVPMIADV